MPMKQFFRDVFRDSDVGGQDVEVLSPCNILIIKAAACSTWLLNSSSFLCFRTLLKFHSWKQSKGAPRLSFQTAVACEACGLI